MFSHNTKRTTYRRRHRYAVERLEGRLLLASDVNIGIYVIDCANDAVDCEYAETDAAYVDTETFAEVDAVEEKSRDVPLDQPDPESDAGTDPHGSSTPEPDPEEEDLDNLTTLIDGQGPGSADGSPDEESTEFASDPNQMITLPGFVTESGKKVFQSGGETSGAFDEIELDRFHYFMGRENQRLSDEPSLVRESLGEHVQRDTFMAMSLLDPVDQMPEASARRENVPLKASVSSLARPESLDDNLGEEVQDIAMTQWVSGSSETVKRWSLSPLLGSTLAGLMGYQASEPGSGEEADGGKVNVNEVAQSNVDLAAELADVVHGSPDPIRIRDTGARLAAFAFVSTILTQRGGFFQTPVARENHGRVSETCGGKSC
ncbi:hypothetical protein [Aporhodopirellula aestuarii]|uniref:Uncharacterized protein n=1 Tax=Aporhodopirellula aestuarii TaxID=2950107 RepID=A0ABT0UFI1_9BACT|nr:hypothetical protein [Aporhodopirellula aestuarii]MCM2375085.1 hypothetical protein [Aporhodopirellula aestuarii]